VLLENAVKHNRFSSEQPLEVRLAIERDTISICNDTHRTIPSNDSSHLGLKNFDERYRLIMRKGIRVESASSRFTVTLPLMKAS